MLQKINNCCPDIARDSMISSRSVHLKVRGLRSWRIMRNWNWSSSLGIPRICGLRWRCDTLLKWRNCINFIDQAEFWSMLGIWGLWTWGWVHLLFAFVLLIFTLVAWITHCCICSLYWDFDILFRRRPTLSCCHLVYLETSDCWPGGALVNVRD